MIATVTRRGGTRIADRNLYELRTDHRPTEAEIVTAQTSAGFSPGGYGGPDDVATMELPDRTFLTRWSSSGRAD